MRLIDADKLLKDLHLSSLEMIDNGDKILEFINKTIERRIENDKDLVKCAEFSHLLKWEMDSTLR